MSKIGNWFARQAYRQIVEKEVNCPSCTATIKRHGFSDKDGVDAVITCPECGWKSPIGTLPRIFEVTPKEVHQQPADSKIEARIEPNRSLSWYLPASKKGNFLLLFGFSWFGFVGLFTAVAFMIFNEDSIERGERIGMVAFLIPTRDFFE